MIRAKANNRIIEVAQVENKWVLSIAELVEEKEYTAFEDAMNEFSYLTKPIEDVDAGYFRKANVLENTYYFNEDGQWHREDGPAIEFADGTRKWYVNDVIHRDNGPAIEGPDGYKAWYFNGKCHREDGPAIERLDGHMEWYWEGKAHRDDGPAIVYPNGHKEWYIKGEKVQVSSQKEFEEFRNKK